MPKQKPSPSAPGAPFTPPRGIGYVPSRGFFTEDIERDTTIANEAALMWLLDRGQRTPAKVGDTEMFELFIAPFATGSGEQKAVPSAAIAEIARETVAALRRLIVDRVPWELPLVSRVLERDATLPYVTATVAAKNWKDAFRARAGELTESFGHRIRVCKRDDCKHLLYADDARRVFCSQKCSQKSQFEKYVSRAGGAKNYQRKRRELRAKKSKNSVSA